MSNVSKEEIALELVRIEKEKPSSHDQKDAATLYESYVQKVYDAYQKCTEN